MLTFLLKYGFFDSSVEVARNGYHGEDRMSPKQFIVMGIIFLLIIAISIIIRKYCKSKLYTIYKVLAIFMPILEITKISYSTYFDFLYENKFNYGGILPLYTCSMLLYLLPVLVWGKGKFKEYAMAFFTTIGLVAGLSNFVYLSAAGYYPIFSFAGLYSVVFHAVIVFIGMSLMITGEYLPSFKTIYQAMIVICLFSVIVIPANFIIKLCTPDKFVDYMLLMDGNGISIFGDFSHYLQSKGLHLLFSFFMLFICYPIATALITLIDMGIIKLVHLFKKPKSE